MNDQREHTIRGKPLSQCPLEVLVKEREDARLYFENNPPMSPEQKWRMRSLIEEIHQRRKRG